MESLEWKQSQVESFEEQKLKRQNKIQCKQKTATYTEKALYSYNNKSYTKIIPSSYELAKHYKKTSKCDVNFVYGLRFILSI